MPDNGSHQLQTVGGERLCEIVSQSERLERTKIATKLYGGNYLVQTVGAPTRILDLQLRAWSREEQAAVNAAEAENTVVVAQLDEDQIRGYLLEAPDWSVVANAAGIFDAPGKLVVIDG